MLSEFHSCRLRTAGDLDVAQALSDISSALLLLLLLLLLHIARMRTSSWCRT
jgi:hypothetical protein